MREYIFLDFHIWCFIIQIWIWRKRLYVEYILTNVKSFWNGAQSANCDIPPNFNYSNQIIHILIISADFTQTAGCSCSSLLFPVQLHGNVFDDSLLQPLLALVRHLMCTLAGKGWLGEREPSFLITHCYSQSRALSGEAPFGPLPPVPGLLWVNSLINNQAN